MAASTRSLFFVALSFLGAATSHGQLSDRELAGLADEFRKSMGLENTVSEIQAGNVDAKRLAILRAVLSATNEVHIHQQRGATGNRVFLHPDGHREAVYGPEGVLVADGINDGSYNYFHPRTDAVRHFFYDIHPWLRWGNSRKDPTAHHERLSAYMKDLDVGVVRAAQLGSFSEVDVGVLRDGEGEAYAIFLDAIREGEADEFFTAIESRKILVDEVRLKIMKDVEAGLRSRYSERE